MRADRRLGRGAAARRHDGRVALAFVLVLAAGTAGVEAADRPDLRYPEPLPESEAALEPAPSSETPGGGLTLVWFDPRELVPEAFGPVSREVRGIFGGMGVAVRWERGTSDTVIGERAGLEIPIILLRSDPAAARNGPRRVLGLVPKAQNGPRTVWAFLDNVRRTLGHNPRNAISSREGDELGLALARVVAHEVVHVVAPDEPHTPSGLMHHSMDRRFLLGMSVPIDPGCARVFQRTLAERLSPAAPAAAARTGEIGVSAP